MGKIVRVIQYEIGMEIKAGLAGELEATCQKYGIPNICLFSANPNQIDFHIKRFSYNLQWQKYLELRTLPTVIHPGKARHRHMTLPYNQGRAYQAYELGLLIFKDSKEWMFPQKHRGDKKCLNIPAKGQIVSFTALSVNKYRPSGHQPGTSCWTCPSTWWG